MKDLVTAFEQQLADRDFSAAIATLTQMQQQNPNDAQVQIFEANLYRVSGEPDKAEVIYRKILRNETLAKLLTQARQGLQIIDDTERHQQKQAIATAVNYPENRGLGFLGIRPMDLSNSPQDPTSRKAIAEKVARIFHIDTLTAKMLIPSRNLKIVRIGVLGELSVYGEQLRQVGIPAIWVSLGAIAKINVYTINYFEISPKNQICAVHDGGEIRFKWSEVSDLVQGLLPTFGDVVDVDAKHQLIRKEQILDRVRICDLHLPSQNCILRFHDNHYQFDRGIQLEVKQSPALKHIAPTVQQRWASLMQWLNQSLAEMKIQDNFLPFAEAALEFPEFLGELKSHIDLERRKESLWDNSFQLYSGMIYTTDS